MCVCVCQGRRNGFGIGGGGDLRCYFFVTHLHFKRILFGT